MTAPGDAGVGFLEGGGELGALMRATDWTRTALGPIERWPQSLRTSVSTCLNSRFPILVWWGPQLIKLYNDAYRPMLGEKHPRSLGAPGIEVWPEIWHIIGPMLEGVLRRGDATWSDDQLLVLERHGYPEECYFTYSYSPIRDESGGIGGVFCAVQETTQRVVGERRLATLRSVAEAVVEAEGEADACARAARALEGNLVDLPFALVYRLSSDGREAQLAGCAGIAADGTASPSRVALEPGDGPAGWPLARVAATGTAELVTDLTARFGALPGGPWEAAPERALVLPIARPAQEVPYGILVAAVSPRRPLDEDYRGYYDLLAGHLATAIGNARAHEEERRRAAALAELDRAKTVFFSNVSHEFRTPLTLLLGQLEDGMGDAEHPLPAAQVDRQRVIHRNALRLLKLVNSLLDFSRIEAGRVRASYEPVDLASFTADLASVFRSAIEQAGLRFRVDCPPLPEAVYVDRDMWEKIVLNLLSNAFKHTFEGEVRVTVREAEGCCTLEVADTGIGIDERELPRLFERFHRVEGARGRTHEGTGIGLALVQELVRLHGGSITVASALGSGSAFTVRLPFGSAHLPADRVGSGTAASTDRTASAYVEEALRWLPDGDDLPAPGIEDTLGGEPGGGTAGPSQARVLIADDNADMRDYLRRLLGRRWTVTAVRDGASALAAVRADPPDLVVADVMMPGLDGLALLRELRDDPGTRAVPVILLSARAGEESRVQGMQAGADDYLVKPFAARELIARVEAALTMGRIRREAARALRESEQRFRALVDAAPLGIYLVDDTFRIQHVNPVALPAFGAIPNLVGRDFEEVIRMLWPKPYADEVVSRCRHALATGESWVEPEWIEGRLDRERTEVYEWRIDRIPLAEGRHGVVCYFRDISAQVHARWAVEAARAEAEEANQAKSHFLANMSHELRTPLNAVLGYADLLREEIGGPLTPLQRQQLGRIEAGGRRLMQLIEQLLSFARLDAGQEEVRLETVDLTALARDTASLVDPLARGKRLAFEVSTPESPLPVATDAAKVRQILLNLLSNSMKFTPAGTVLLRVRPQHTDVLIEVEDTGPGIADEDRERIFDAFYQASGAATGPSGGTGLGLSVSRGLARLLGGDVVVESAVGRGSTFTLRLPRGARAIPAAERTQVGSVETGSTETGSTETGSTETGSTEMGAAQLGG